MVLRWRKLEVRLLSFRGGICSNDGGGGASTHYFCPAEYSIKIYNFLTAILKVPIIIALLISLFIAVNTH